MFTTTKRIIKSGFLGFYRNAMISFSAIVIIVISLLSFAAVYFISLILTASVAQLEQKVDINVYFATDAPEETIFEIREQVEQIDQVASVEYVNREDAYQAFLERNQGNEIVTQTLEALDDNPLGALFNIKAQQISEYDQIATVLETIQNSESLGPFIDNINYYQNREAINKLNIIISSVRTFGFVFSILLVVLSIIITFNTIRLTIYSSRNEIAVMRLVGASRFFARGPFLIEGVVYGFVSAVIALAIMWPTLYYANPALREIFVFNTYQYFLDNLFLIAGSLLLAGILLGLISSYLAIRRYLNI